MQSCPAAQVLWLTLHSAPDDPLREALDAHLDGCAACRRMVADMVSEDQAGPPPRLQLAPGVTIGRYLIESEGGGGQSGRVFAALDGKLGRKVALKVLAPGLGGATSEARARLEGQLGARLNHGNVATVLEVDVLGGLPVVVSEWVEGRELRQCVREASQREVLGWMGQAARGLGAAHAAGVVHRDFKPENVLVRADGVVKLIDFSLATTTDQAVPFAAAAGGGTPLYMSPEQLDGAPADPASDRWAFLVVLAEVLGGEHPFAASSRAELAAAQRRGPRLRGGLPRRLRQVLEAGLVADPARRSQLALDRLAELLERAARRPARGLLLATAALMCLVMVWVAGRSWPAQVPLFPLGAAWNASRRLQLATAMAARHELPALAFVSEGLDRRAEQLVHALAEPHASAARRRCLEVSVSELELVGAAALRADRFRTEVVLEGLDRGEPCPPGRERGRFVQQVIMPVVVAELIELRLLAEERHEDEALRRARGVARLAGAFDLDWQAADAELLAGKLLASRFEAAAEGVYLRALEAAQRAGDIGRTVEAIAGLCYVDVNIRHDLQAALARVDLGEALARGATASAEDRARLGRVRGVILVARQDYPAARRALEAALDELLHARGEGPWLSAYYLALARMAFAEGDFVSALEQARRSTASWAEAWGPDHPSGLRSLAVEVDALDQLGEHEAALATARRASAVAERALDPLNPERLWMTLRVASVLIELERPQEAEVLVCPLIESQVAPAALAQLLVLTCLEARVSGGHLDGAGALVTQARAQAGDDAKLRHRAEVWAALIAALEGGPDAGPVIVPDRQPPSMRYRQLRLEVLNAAAAVRQHRRVDISALRAAAASLPGPGAARAEARLERALAGTWPVH